MSHGTSSARGREMSTEKAWVEKREKALRKRGCIYILISIPSSFVALYLLHLPNSWWIFGIMSWVTAFTIIILLAGVATLEEPDKEAQKDYYKMKSRE